MANNPYVNKVVFGSATLVDLTGTTATADKILSGYGAFGADGAWMDGTATGGSGGNVWQDAQGYVHLDDEGTPPVSVESLSVTQNGTYTAPTGKAYSPVTVNVSGGGGLEYETGTWTPSEETDYPTILFSNTHSTLPIMIEISDVSGAFVPSGTAACSVWGYYDAWKATGYGFPASSPDVAYSYIDVYYVSTSGNGTSTRRAITHNSSESGSGASYVSYYVTASSFMPYTLGARYYKAGRTYKWIAVWAPTT